ncbi:PBSX family phage terminase large subunit [Amycolatopsis sp. H20-H5]|uniref:PBSX family phage terminase large subunit n=1 Tax=Amycolatopsis sp. H20-H5 TaxID=3046309 RepID=UPI002DB6CE48|nr:PBSX family phage terminase large subunit [Amycolatopsis sp. H20-H5]MEC3977888.1 PBSX family phage terminase large subunit [Amycolatopsis sp. H20-H5]
MVAELRLSTVQERSIAQATARINVWDGSVRSGKTISSLLRWLMFVANAPRGGALVVIGKTYDTVSRNVFGPLTDPAITGAKVAKLIRYTRGAPTATILGRTIEVITANDARAEGRLRGLTAAGAYVDEATLIPENFWDQLLARLSVPGAQLFATTNPDNPGHWLRKKFILRAGELDLRYWHFTIEDNHALGPAYVRNLKKEYVGLWYRRFILGHWVQAEGAVYDMWDPEKHVVDQLPRIVRWIGLGIDYGTVNPFAGLLLGLGDDRRLYLTSEYRYDSKVSRRSKTDAEYSAALTSWLDGIDNPNEPDVKGVYPEWTVVDPSAASFVQQLHRDGRVTPALANNAVLDGIRTVSSLLAADQLRVHRSCEGWTDEIGGYSWDDAAAAKGEDKVIKVDDHSLDAGRYVLHTTRAAWRNELQEAA